MVYALRADNNLVILGPPIWSCYRLVRYGHPAKNGENMLRCLARYGELQPLATSVTVTNRVLYKQHKIYLEAFHYHCGPQHFLHDIPRAVLYLEIEKRI